MSPWILSSRPATIRRWAPCLALLALLTPAPAAGDAAHEATPSARAHFQAAEAHFNLGEFTEALEEYRKAYQLRPLAPLLFNMAQCHRHLDDLERAAFLLKRFLGSSPTEEQRRKAEAVLSQVESALKARAKPGAASSPPATAVDGASSAPAATSRPSRVDPAPGVGAALDPVHIPAVTPARPGRSEGGRSTRRPIYQRWWFWTLVGGAVAATATTVGVLTGRHEELPQGSLPAVDYR